MMISRKVDISLAFYSVIPCSQIQAPSLRCCPSTEAPTLSLTSSSQFSKKSLPGTLQWVRGPFAWASWRECYVAVWFTLPRGDFSPWSFLSLQLVNNPLASQAAAAAAAMGSIASSQAFGNALSSLQGVTGQLVTNAQGQVSGRREEEWIFTADWTRKGNEFLLHDSDM